MQFFEHWLGIDALRGQMIKLNQNVFFTWNKTKPNKSRKSTTSRNSQIFPNGGRLFWTLQFPLHPYTQGLQCKGISCKSVLCKMASMSIHLYPLEFASCILGSLHLWGAVQDNRIAGKRYSRGIPPVTLQLWLLDTV